MVDKKEKKIDGMEVMVTQFPARFGFKMQAKLVKIFGPVIGVLLGGTEGDTDKILDSNLDAEKLAGAIAKLFDSVDENEALALVLQLMQTTRINGQEVNETSFDSLFPGKYQTMYKVLGFVLEVNYGSFFGEGGIGKAMKKLSPTA